MSTPVLNQPVTNQNVNQNLTNSQVDPPLPSSTVMMQAAKLAMQDDRAIMLDYYAQTLNNTAFLGEDGETKERVLVKSKEEFTSLIKKLYKVGEDFIILTENSLYVVSGKIQKRKINLSSLHDAYGS